jgi:hypothetical protein
MMRLLVGMIESWGSVCPPPRMNADGRSEKSEAEQRHGVVIGDRLVQHKRLLKVLLPTLFPRLEARNKLQNG